MAALSKPKARINHVAPEEDKKKSRRIGGDINTFFFRDDVKVWCSGKSDAAKKAKPLF